MSPKVLAAADSVLLRTALPGPRPLEVILAVAWAEVLGEVWAFQEA